MFRLLFIGRSHTCLSALAGLPCGYSVRSAWSGEASPQIITTTFLRAGTAARTPIHVTGAPKEKESLWTFVSIWSKGNSWGWRHRAHFGLSSSLYWRTSCVWSVTLHSLSKIHNWEGSCAFIKHFRLTRINSVYLRNIWLVRLKLTARLA